MLLVKAMEEEGLSIQEAASRIYLFDIHGLIVKVEACVLFACAMRWTHFEFDARRIDRPVTLTLIKSFLSKTCAPTKTISWKKLLKSFILPF